ncbi:EXOIII [Musa troglodytarum]|uniref:EXOIII n=1 Tax=Musa troglodytarum TaxID=320322 RepID=A0A9E7L449_9LILI|nr:EXOIII [Musa troglodytarum]URE45264.1 EXOIII [Musa troglodytarum]URE45265.1 EXOIII [Musa troglodytarum]URE45266.1 EXOIII [Musa troglodytarum]
MSLASIWSGNFHQLWSSLRSNSNIKFLRFSTKCVPDKSFDARRCLLRQLTNVVEELRQVPHSFITSCTCRDWRLEKVTIASTTNRNTHQQEIHELKAVQCYNIQESTLKKSVERPATILVFDIETTGFSHQNERIIEFALRDLIGGKNSTFQTLVNPEKDVLNAFVHGIDTSMVNRHDVPTFRELLPVLLQYVRSRQMAGRPVLWVAHNGRKFDVPFIIKEFQRCSVEIPADWMFVDTLPLARQLTKPDGTKLTSSSLKALREHYEIPLVGPAHRAMQDVMTLCYVLQKITFDLKLSIPELMDRAFLASDFMKVPLEKRDGGVQLKSKSKNMR